MCGNGKSFLVETGTFQSNLRDGTRKEPKFELDSLEIKVHLITRRIPDVLLKIESSGRRHGDLGLYSPTAQQEGIKPGNAGMKSKVRKEIVGNTEDTSSRKAIRNVERST
jgi:hypothetical protein